MNGACIQGGSAIYRYVHDLLEAAARRDGSHPAVVCGSRTLTYSQLLRRSEQIGGLLLSRGVQKGDRVVLLLPHHVDMPAAVFAVSRIGAVFVILNPNLKDRTLRHILEDCRPSLIMTTRAELKKRESLAEASNVAAMEDLTGTYACDALPAGLIPNDPVCLIYTSGSTGESKAVISTHRNVLFAVAAIQEVLGMVRGDRILSVLPMSFDYGLYQLFLACFAGATLVMGDELAAGAALWKSIRDLDITGLPIVPHMAGSLMMLGRRYKSQIPSVRFITSTGAHFPQAYIRGLQALFPRSGIFVMYGLTECKRVSILTPQEYLQKPDSVGRPLPMTDCFAADHDGRPLPAGQIGELVVRGPHVMQGYWNAPELTAKHFKITHPFNEMMLFTGDYGYVDEDGYLYYVGRKDDLYKKNGYRVSALEVEDAAAAIPGVEEACLVTVADSPILFVRSALSKEEIMARLDRRLEKYKLPDQIVLVDEFPLTVHGKIDKTKLKAHFLAGDGHGYPRFA